ncbi:hypothetical protein Nepgr_026445 [Nepenthes gracilis]|uniref:CTLH domain-containing protein n=1 Tax=Nepenthes gracilis TaxID=150966 RepID=A0AAD3T9Q1_NEPGR|nr:hypothetical protein Nepgr_026445 [Nepenthes gracilis]
MDSTPVNWEALDRLVIEFAKSENLIEESSSPPSSPSSSSQSPSSSSYQSRLLIRQIRRSLESGDISSALDLLHLRAPAILDDHRLLFRLQKQKFIELLRRGTTEGRELAINCLRTALAPCALDAYPEAYEEFKHILLALVYDKDDRNSPIANEWAEKQRSEIAGLVSSILRAHLHAYDPLFSMSLRYLISVHKAFCFRQEISSPISDLTQRLLLEERDPPATPQESLYEAPPFDEVDIQALAHAVELTRQKAVDSLRFAKGDLFQAFQNELCRMRLNISTIDELVREYCIYRGIVDPAISSAGCRLQPLSKDSMVNQLEPLCCSSRNCNHEVECGNSKNSDCESSISYTHLETSELSTATIIIQDRDAELQSPCEMANIPEDCSSGSHQPKSLKVPQKNRSHAASGRNRRKRWRGRSDEFEFPNDVPLDGSNQLEYGKMTSKEVSEKCCSLDVMHNWEDKYEIALGMKELASRGMAAEVVEEVNAVDPYFFGQNPILLFQLKQVEFLTLVGSGDYSGALKVACAHLGPLAANDPALLKPLKETLLALIKPDEEALKKDFPLNALASSLQVAIGRRLGIEEPQLMKILRATLYSHNEWFKLHMCKDRFESLLKIDSLKEVVAPLLTDVVSRLNASTCAQGSSQITMSSSSRVTEDGNSPTQVSSRDLHDENAILKVMEFLALPRADAIHLLAQYSGDAETVIQQIFA